MTDTSIEVGDVLYDVLDDEILIVIDFYGKRIALQNRGGDCGGIHSAYDKPIEYINNWCVYIGHIDRDDGYVGCPTCWHFHNSVVGQFEMRKRKKAIRSESEKQK